MEYLWIVLLIGVVAYKVWRALRRKPSRVVPAAVKSAVWIRDGGRCQHCGIAGGKFNPMEYDHVKPYSWGGSSKDPGNIQLLCERCNLSKGARYQG